MSSTVYFKWKAGKEVFPLTFEGTKITVIELKQKIFDHQKLTQDRIDLRLTNHATGQTYSDMHEKIDKNVTLEISRCPVKQNTRRPNLLSQPVNPRAPNAQQSLFSSSIEELPAAVDIAPDTTEDEAIQLLAADSHNYQTEVTKNTLQWARKLRPKQAKPPPEYICRRCGTKGDHWNDDCDKLGQSKISSVMGVPLNHIKRVADPKGHENVVLLRDGTYGIVAPQDRIFEKKMRASEKESAQGATDGASKVPEFLRCTHCEQLLQTPCDVLCCHKKFCSDCIHTLLHESKPCPACGTTLLQESIVPDHDLGTKVHNHKLRQLGVDTASTNPYAGYGGGSGGGGPPPHKRQRRGRGNNQPLPAWAMNQPLTAPLPPTANGSHLASPHTSTSSSNPYGAGGYNAYAPQVPAYAQQPMQYPSAPSAGVPPRGLNAHQLRFLQNPPKGTMKW
eukprot:TRINITY_DN57033_c0_g1_i1.p1 TRINITY_DN57033_c0_g1~~TRINITY_DN57033_c0_g1_i1.p1  ORF type:complete len:448 (-),score=22.50 TRINITY_DN57033_c0_g1_i1:109-1452(-)